MPRRIVLVSGAEQGVGYAIAQSLAASGDGYHIFITSSNLEAAEKALISISANMTNAKNRLYAIQLDSTNAASIDDAKAFIDDRYGRLNVLINVGVKIPALNTKAGEHEENSVDFPPLSIVFRPLLLRSSNPYSLYIRSYMEALAPKAENAEAHSSSDTTNQISREELKILVEKEHAVYGDEGLKVFALNLGTSATHGKSNDENGNLILRILRGERDNEAGRLVH
ncbi:uncharacterized protein PV09_05182 [Verruconis gallopava]|uniref:Uncharacterized protein n=1 Tax=Verruconis gallopava TaxID=253628 RepID=A0A0D1YS07_9PEZI|nr:uncharacterized protein PV09_05182 [Verruconis gallopava]KIW03407.1 hypothetical protein PV09_05182 [Verruconis gallopava]